MISDTMTNREAIDILRVINPPRESKRIFDDFIQARDMAIAALEKQEQNRWIPVTERPSEKYKDVLVTDREVSDVYVSHYCGGGYWPTDTGCANNRIIAWRPLPEPYQEEEA